MNSIYKESMSRHKVQLSIDIFGFEIAKLSALIICLKVEISNFPLNLLNLKISAIINHRHLTISVPALIVSRERSMSQIFCLGPSFYIMKC